MKSFRATHTIFNTTFDFDESTLPTWLSHKDFKWFYDAHVSTLDISKSIETDFHTIRRMS